MAERLSRHTIEVIGDEDDFIIELNGVAIIEGKRLTLEDFVAFAQDLGFKVTRTAYFDEDAHAPITRSDIPVSVGK